MPDTNRDDMMRAFQIAFDEWDRRYALNEAGFMGDVKHRGAFFVDLLDELAAGKPWGEIGHA